MASSGEEAYEVSLGNKHLLALFFIVTGFFALFFCAGYMIGFGHGEKAPGVVKVEEPPPEPAPPSLPATLRQDPPAPPPPITAAASPKPEPAPKAAPSAQPKPSAPASAPKRTAPEKPTPKKSTPAPKPAPAAAAAGAGGYYLQVAAVRVQADATELAGKLKSKGYPAVVNASKGDGWQRVVVGPFSSPEAAQSFKSKLSKDGFDTMLRKL